MKCIKALPVHRQPLRLESTGLPTTPGILQGVLALRWDQSNTGMLIVFDLSDLKPEHFDDLIEAPIPLSGTEMAFILKAVVRLKSPSPRAQPFSLILQAPVNTKGAQGIYALRHPDLGVLEIFLVPIAPVDGLPSFEAVFN